MSHSLAKEQKGFMLVELLVTLAVVLVLIGFLSSTFVFQRKAYNTQQQISEMLLNARAGMDVMTSEIMMTGYGVTTTELSTWLNWAGVSFDDDPVLIENGTGALGSDIIHVAGCFDGAATTLAANASPRRHDHFGDRRLQIQFDHQKQYLPQRY
jgi:prepilin-type N-terminal cleavage/methylation domain-containing protein